MDDKALAQYLLQGGTMPMQTMQQVYGFTGFPSGSNPNGMGGDYDYVKNATTLNSVGPVAKYAPASNFDPNGMGGDYDPIKNATTLNSVGPAASFAVKPGTLTTGGTASNGMRLFSTSLLGNIVDGTHQLYSTETPAPSTGISPERVATMGKPATPEDDKLKKLTAIADGIYGSAFAGGWGSNGFMKFEPAQTGTGQGWTDQERFMSPPPNVPGLVTGPRPPGLSIASTPVARVLDPAVHSALMAQQTDVRSPAPGVSYLEAQGKSTSGMTDGQIANELKKSMGMY